MAAQIQNSTDWYAASFGRFEKSLNGESATRLHAVRREAIERFAASGFPTTDHEEWRFTNLSQMAKIPFTPVVMAETQVNSDAVARFLFADMQAVRLVFVDGHFQKDLSDLNQLPDGVRVESLASAVRNGGGDLLSKITAAGGDGTEALVSLNTAFLQDGALVIVPDRVEVKIPIHLLYISSDRVDPFLSSPRNLFMVGESAVVSIVETYAGVAENMYLTNVVTDFLLAKSAVVEHDKLQVESGKGYHMATTVVRQKGGSSYTSNSVSLGGLIVRNTVTAVLDGERCVSTLNGLSIGTGRQLVDNHTVIDHAKPNCESHELYKSILDGHSKGVFNGKIFVRKDAQKTDAKQTNKTLLLSDDATIDTKPQLEIFADDVKCTHGATVGQLDEEQAFYLRSRGVGSEEARAILTFAFASDIVSRVHVEPLRVQLDGLIRERLRDGRVHADGDKTG